MIGAFGENFPYTNFHDMNLDWILKVIKEVNEKYPKLINDLMNTKLDKPINSGTVGDFLYNNGDGTTSWKSMDMEIGEEIQEVVIQWLEDHPEATTTVQDGAITPAKLNTELYNLYKESGKTQFFYPDLSAGGYSGTSFMMVTPHKTVIFDTNATLNQTQVIDYYTQLYDAGVFTNIDYIIISHYHFDHVQNLEAILTAFPHEGCKLYIPISPSGYYIATVEPELITNYNTVISIANTYSIEYHIVTEDTTLNIDDLVSINMFNSDTASYEYYSNMQYPYNDYSMVSLVKIGSIYAMYPGDLQKNGQERIMTYKTLPSLFLYTVHHHSIQNDDYLPYIQAINPQYNVITTSHNRQITSGRYSMFVKVSSGVICSTAYDSYSFVCDGQSGSITSGTKLPNSGWNKTTIDLYVNNEYTGTKRNGTELYPFTELSEALMFIKYNQNLDYTIHVKKTDTPYSANLFIRDIPNYIYIIGDGGYPDINWMYINNCPHVDIQYVNFTGNGYSGYPSSSKSSSIVIFDSGVAIYDCTADGTDMGANGYFCSLRNSSVLLTRGTISDYADGFITSYSSMVSNVVVRETEFTDISASLFHVEDTKFYIDHGCTFTNVEYIIAGAPERGVPVKLDREYCTPEFASNCTASAICEPIYLSASHPVVLISNKKVYDLLTGSEIE